MQAEHGIHKERMERRHRRKPPESPRRTLQLLWCIFFYNNDMWQRWNFKLILYSSCFNNNNNNKPWWFNFPLGSVNADRFGPQHVSNSRNRQTWTQYSHHMRPGRGLYPPPLHLPPVFWRYLSHGGYDLYLINVRVCSELISSGSFLPHMDI